MQPAYTDGHSEFTLKKVSLQFQGEVHQHSMHMNSINCIACSEIRASWNTSTQQSSQFTIANRMRQFAILSKGQSVHYRPT